MTEKFLFFHYYILQGFFLFFLCVPSKKKKKKKKNIFCEWTILLLFFHCDEWGANLARRSRDAAYS